MPQAGLAPHGRVSPFARLSLLPLTVHVLTTRQEMLDNIEQANRLRLMVTCWEIDFICPSSVRHPEPAVPNSYDSLRFIKCVLKVEAARVLPSWWKRFTPSHMNRAQLWFWSSVIKRRRLLPDAPTNLCEACINLAATSWTKQPLNAIDGWFDDADHADEAFGDAVRGIFHAERRYLVSRQAYAERYATLRGATRATSMAVARRVGGGLPVNPYKHLRFMVRNS